MDINWFQGTLQNGLLLSVVFDDLAVLYFNIVLYMNVLKILSITETLNLTDYKNA